MKTEDLENQDEQKWNDVNEMLSNAGSQLNILEEQIDVEEQQLYMQLLGQLIKDPKIFKKLTLDAPQHTQTLFDENAREDEKKTLLVLLATINDVSIYRTIETFQKMNTPIKKWATIALQQSRMLIQSALLDESTVFVSTGRGGQGTLLRYFCVYIANDDTVLEPFQWDIAKKETELVVKKAKGEIEQFKHYKRYITFMLLLPINANLKDIFETVIDECNTYGNFLQENIIITNVKKLTTKEIDAFLRSKQRGRK